MAAKNFAGNTLHPIKITKDNETVEISNQSLRLDARSKQISYELKWTIGHIRHSQTVLLKAGENYIINKSDWRELDKHDRITNNLKLSIQAQDICEDFLFGPSKNHSELESVSFQKTENGIKILFRIMDMDNVVSLMEQNFTFGFEESEQELRDQINDNLSEIPGYFKDFEDLKLVIEMGSDVDNNYSKTTTFSTNHKYLAKGKSGPVRIEVTDHYQRKFHQEQFETKIMGNNLCFSVIDCKENGERQKRSNEIGLSYSNYADAFTEIEEFNTRLDYFLIDRPIKSIKSYAVKIPVQKWKSKFALEIDYIRVDWLTHSPIAVFIPHLTLLEEKARAVNITNAEFEYDNDSIFPIKLLFTYPMEHPFTKSSDGERQYGIPTEQLVPYILRHGEKKFRRTLGKKTETGWIEYGIYKEKSLFENAPFIPIELNPIIKEYTGKSTGKTFFYDVYNGLVGYLSDDSFFIEIENIQMWMIGKEEGLHVESRFKKYFPPDEKWDNSEGTS